MSWTKEPPSEPGYYWVELSDPRAKLGDAMQIAEVGYTVEGERHWYLAGEEDARFDDEFAAFWSEPITMPAPPTTPTPPQPESPAPTDPLAGR